MLKPLQIGTLVLPRNVMLAPLAGITNHAFRTLCRREGACLAFTEMVSVHGLTRAGAATLGLLKSSPGDRPLGIQIFGDAPADLAEAARMLNGHGDLLDINMGCPVRKVVGAGAGSALLREPLKVAAIIRAVRAATPLPLTIKIRSGWRDGDDAYREIGRIAAEEGCDAVTLHPRSRGMGFSGHADWSQIKMLKEALPIPVIGSGDLFTAEDCLGMLAETGCDGIMVARGALGAPWIFSRILNLASGATPLPVTNTARAAAIRKHLELYIRDRGEAVAAREMKKHIGWYAKGFPGASDIRRAANEARTTNDIAALAEKIDAMPDTPHEN